MRSNELSPLMYKLLKVITNFAVKLRMTWEFDETEYNEMKTVIKTVLETYIPTGTLPTLAVHLFMTLPSSLEGCIVLDYHTETQQQRIIEASRELIELIASMTDTPNINLKPEDEFVLNFDK